MPSLNIWKDLPADPSRVAQIQDGCARENIERLNMGTRPNGGYSAIESGVAFPQTIKHDLECLSEIVKLAAAGADVVIGQAVSKSNSSSDLGTEDKLLQTLKLSGLVVKGQPEEIALAEDEKKELAGRIGLTEDFKVVKIVCQTHNFEHGSSQKLSLKKKPKPAEPSAKTAAVWSLAMDDMEDDDLDEDLVDPDALLREDDFKKPDPSTLRVCGSTGKRKACKDCSCGLAEELDAGKTPTTKSVTSSCGSCYLGDAFRCASCPYLGMPAFKPGQKIQLSQRQLNADN